MANMNTFIHLNKLQGLATKSKSSILATAFVACATLCFIAAIGTANTAKAASAAVAAQDGSLGAKQQRRVPSLRSNVYDQLARAQKTADDGDVVGAIAILDEVQAKSSSMNSYERAMMFNFYGFIYYAEEDFDKTIESFKAAVNEQPIPVQFEQATLFSLAQLSMAQSKFDDVIDYIERWEALNNGKIPPKNYILKAQALYQGKRYEEAIGYIETAIKNHEEDGYLPDENWLVLQRAIYFELKQPEKVKEIIVKLIRLYDAPQYWIQLAGMYGELEQEKKQLATMEIAYQRGYIDSASDTFNLAQLYYYHGIPYKGAALMAQAIESGQLEANLRNLKFLGQAWQLAQEDEKAVPVMQQAAALSDNGEIDAQLALLLYNLDKFDEAISAANKAIEKGGLPRAGDTHVVLGLALYNQGQYAQALEQLSLAEEFSTSRATARQWGRFVEREQRTAIALQELNSAP
jgi:tetratricopeptide (TPR) repeat protein